MYCSYLFLYQSSDYVVCMIKKMFILNQQIHLYANLPYQLFKMSKLIHLPLNLVRTDHEILFLNSKLFLKLSLI